MTAQNSSNGDSSDSSNSDSSVGTNSDSSYSFKKKMACKSRQYLDKKKEEEKNAVATVKHLLLPLPSIWPYCLELLNPSSDSLILSIKAIWP